MAAESSERPSQMEIPQPQSRAAPWWRDHPTGALFGPSVLSLSGADVLRSMKDGTVPDPPLTRLADLRVTEVGLGTATMAMPSIGWWQSGAGVFPAGVLAFLADGALGSAALTAAPAGLGMMTTAMALDFVRPATVRSGWMIGRGRVTHATRSQALAEAFIEDGRGRLLAHGTSRGLLTPIDRGTRPAGAGQAAADDGGVNPYELDAEGDVLDQRYWNTHDGSDVVRAFTSGALSPPIVNFTGIRFSAGGDGTVRAHLPTSRWLANAYGVLFGGAVALLADIAMSTTVLARLPRATSFAPLDLKINFLRPLLPETGDATAIASVVHTGRTISVVSCEVVDPKGKPAAVATETILVLPGRPWERPVSVGEEMPVEPWPADSHSSGAVP